MRILNDLSLLSIEKIEQFLSKREKDDKNLLKKMKRKLLTQLYTIDHKQQSLIEAIELDEDDVKSKLRFKFNQTLIAIIEKSIELFESKITSFEEKGWNRLTQLQQIELNTFKKMVSDNGEELILEFFKTAKTAKAQAEKMYEKYCLEGSDAMIEEARSAQNYAIFQLRAVEEEWFQYRISKVATLPSNMQDKTDSFLDTLNNRSEEKLSYLRSKYQGQYRANQIRIQEIESSPQTMHNSLIREKDALINHNTQMSIYINDIRLELASRNITRPKILAKQRPTESPSSVENMTTPVKEILEEAATSTPVFTYKTAKIKVLFSSDAPVQEAPTSRSQTPGIN